MSAGLCLPVLCVCRGCLTICRYLHIIGYWTGWDKTEPKVQLVWRRNTLAVDMRGVHLFKDPHAHTAPQHICFFSHLPFPQQDLHFFSSRFLCLRRFSHSLRENGSSRIAHLQFLEKSLTRGSHHSLTSEDFATDIHRVEHTDTLQPCGLHAHGVGRIDVLTPSRH